jgi:hypothetical protein
MVSVLSLAVAACSSDTAPSASGLAAPSSPATPTTPEPATTGPDDDDDEVTAYCVRGPEGGVPGEEPGEGYRVVDDDLCDDDDLGSDSTPPTTASRSSYFWYYGGRYLSGRVSGGSLAAPADGTITTRSGTTARAGFGGGSRSGG